MSFSLLKHIENQLKSYIGSPVIPVLSQDDEAVGSAFLLGLADYWNVMPLERPYSINVGAGLVKFPLETMMARDIPAEFQEYAYLVGVPFIQFNPVSSVLQTPYASATGASTLDYMVLGTNARNLNVTGSQNIMRGYSYTNSRNPFADVARGNVRNNIVRTTAYQKLAAWSGVSGSVEYNYNTMTKEFEFNIPATTSGVLKFVVGYGFSPEITDDDTPQENEDRLNTVLGLVPNDSIKLLTKIIARKFFEIIIAARGQVNFSGADYTLDLDLLKSTKNKIDSELEKMEVEYGRRLMSWQ